MPAAPPPFLPGQHLSFRDCRRDLGLILGVHRAALALSSDPALIQLGSEGQLSWLLIVDTCGQRTQLLCPLCRASRLDQGPHGEEKVGEPCPDTPAGRLCATKQFPEPPLAEPLPSPAGPASWLSLLSPSGASGERVGSLRLFFKDSKKQ